MKQVFFPKPHKILDCQQNGIYLNTWKSIKISLNSSIHNIPTAITDNATITYPYEVANSFNNYFAEYDISIQSFIKLFKKIVITSSY